jgi:hypothetical protein
VKLQDFRAIRRAASDQIRLAHLDLSALIYLHSSDFPLMPPS